MIILDPTNTDDQASFNEIKALGSVNYTPAQMAVNPLFEDAQFYVLEQLPNVALPGGRTLSSRGEVVIALQFLAAARFLSGSGASESSTTAAGTSTTFRAGPVSKSTSTSSSSGSQQTQQIASVSDRIKFYNDRAEEIIAKLRGSKKLGSWRAIATQSRLPD